MGTMLVMPSCRPDSLAEFFRAWEGRGGWDKVCLVEDAPERSESAVAALPGGSLHYSHKEIAEVAGESAWIFSKRDSAIRCFGFLMAWRAGMDVLTLDDDVFPLNEAGGQPLVGAHCAAMSRPRWVESVPGMRTRGLPYFNLGRVVTDVNVGLWTGVPDLDGPCGLVSPIKDFVPPPGNRIVPAGQLIPVCGMNLFIRHRALPLAYFPLMGEGQPYRRFDDIWGGIILKRGLDELGWLMSVGGPFVEHRRASDPIANLVKEAAGIAANETFWEAVDRATSVGEYGQVKTAEDFIEVVGRGMTIEPNHYIAGLGEALLKWIKLFKEEI